MLEWCAKSSIINMFFLSFSHLFLCVYVCVFVYIFLFLFLSYIPMFFPLYYREHFNVNKFIWDGGMKRAKWTIATQR